MITAALLALLAQASPAPSAASVPWLPSQYSLLCQAAESTGFNWRGEWVRVDRFKLDQYLLAVRNDNFCLKDDLDEERIIEDQLAWRGVCVNLRKVGSPYYRYSSAACTEYYDRRGSDWSISITCHTGNVNGTFAPDGFFHLAHMHEDVTPRGRLNGQKDSLAIEVGRCSLVPT